MKRNTKIILILNIVIIITMLGLLIWQIFFAEERSIKLISRAGALFFVYFLGMTGVWKKKSPLDYILYADEYSHIIGEAFRNDKGAYKKLMKGLTHYKRKKYDKAIGVLNEIKKDCLYADDFTAVLYFKACSYKEKGELYEAEECFKELLEHNDMNASVWESYGELLFDMENYTAALDGYKKAVELAPESVSPYCNLAGCYIKTEQTQKGLETALKALELDGGSLRALSLAAVAYKMLGDNENAEKYCDAFAKNGGDGARLRVIVTAIQKQ